MEDIKEKFRQRIEAVAAEYEEQNSSAFGLDSGLRYAAFVDGATWAHDLSFARGTVATYHFLLEDHELDDQLREKIEGYWEHAKKELNKLLGNP